MNPFDAEDLMQAVAKCAPSAKMKIANAVTESAAASDARSAAANTAREDFRMFTDGERDLLRRFSVEKSTAPNGEPIYNPVKEHRRDFEETTAEVARAAKPVLERWQFWQLRKRAAEKASAAAECWNFLSDLRSWMQENADRRFKHVCPPEAKLTKGQNHADAVHELRARIEEIDSRARALETAPAPVADLIARMNSEIDAMAERLAPALYVNNRDRAPMSPNTSDTHREAFVFWSLADLLKAETAKKLKAAHPGEAVGDLERATDLSALAADKLALERIEEAHVCAAAEMGQAIARRRDASPLAILEVE